MAKRRTKQGNESSTGEVANALRMTGPTASDTKINALVERVIELAQMEPDEVVELVDSGGANEFLDIKELELGDDSNASLRRWKSVKRASPRPLSDEEYKRFLQGLDPIAKESAELEVYGSHLK
jgi:hypothetical protein